MSKKSTHAVMRDDLIWDVLSFLLTSLAILAFEFFPFEPSAASAALAKPFSEGPERFEVGAASQVDEVVLHRDIDGWNTPEKCRTSRTNKKNQREWEFGWIWFTFFWECFLMLMFHLSCIFQKLLLWKIQATWHQGQKISPKALSNVFSTTRSSRLAETLA